MILLVLAAAALAAAPTCPASADPLASLCRALAASDSNNFAAAAAEFERAAEAQGELKLARRFVTLAQASAAEDPFLWYFSAALAIREGDLATARAAIDRAVTLAPDDPDVLFEAGHVAAAEGKRDQARLYWQRAVAADPASASGEAAKRALTLANAPSPPATSPVKPAIKGQ